MIKNRKGEKTHENLLSEPEIGQTLENHICYILTNNDADYHQFKETHQASVLTSFGLLKSDTNPNKLSLPQVKELISKYRENYFLVSGSNTHNANAAND